MSLELKIKYENGEVRHITNDLNEKQSPSPYLVTLRVVNME
jgi:hypothetical protein